MVWGQADLEFIGMGHSYQKIIIYKLLWITDDLVQFCSQHFGSVFSNISTTLNNLNQYSINPYSYGVQVLYVC